MVLNVRPPERQNAVLSSNAVYQRISSLTGIPLKRIEPLVSFLDERPEAHPVSNAKTEFAGEYNPTSHSIIIPAKAAGVIEGALEHEKLHGIPFALGAQRMPAKPGLLNKARIKLTKNAGEMYAHAANPAEPTSLAFAGAAPFFTGFFASEVAGTALVSSIFGAYVRFTATIGGMVAGGNGKAAFSTASVHAASVLAGFFTSVVARNMVKSAIEEYGIDGYIALCATRLRTVSAKSFLHKLEKQGILTPKGFTEKGVDWMASLKPGIENFVENAENTRVMEENKATA